MRVRLWFRPNGAADGLWWTVEVDGSERHVADVVSDAPWITNWESKPDVPRREQRHFVEAKAARVEFEGESVIIHGPDRPRD